MIWSWKPIYAIHTTTTNNLVSNVSISDTENQMGKEIYLGLKNLFYGRWQVQYVLVLVLS